MGCQRASGPPRSGLTQGRPARLRVGAAATPANPDRDVLPVALQVGPIDLVLARARRVPAPPTGIAGRQAAGAVTGRREDQSAGAAHPEGSAVRRSPPD